jgi:hypothetical protein
VAEALFRRLNTEIATGNRSQYVTTDKESWSYCVSGNDQALEQNGVVLKQWIEHACDGIRSAAFSVWTASHAAEQRGPRPKGTSA